MKLETFFEKFDQFADAPDAVEKMRELVLQLAVTGKLVAQNKRDEPASSLLESTEAQRAKLIAAKEIKSRPTSPVEPDEQPFELPSSWAWARLSDVGYELGQKVPDKRFTYIDVGGIDSDKGRISDRVEKLEPGDAPSRARKLVARGTVIYSTVRPYLLNIAIVDQDFDPEPIASTAFGILHPFEGINNRYLFYWLRSAPFTAYVQAGMKGMAYPAINDEKFYSGYIGLPPLAEQKRIVAKVDELMALCDRLEAQQQERETRHAALARASLARFADAPTPANLSFLFHKAYSISPADLRNSILTLAVQGKLVPQDPNDEPAEDFLARTDARHTKPSNGSKSRETNGKAEIPEDEIPFPIPESWAWCRLEVVADKVTDGEHLSPVKTASGMPLLTATHVTAKGVSLNNPQYVSVEDGHKSRQRCDPTRGDILICSRGTIGRCAVVETDEVFCLMGSVILVRFPAEASPRYFNSFLSTDLAQAEMRGMSGATAVQALYLKDIRQSLVPVPPLAEQRRIVAKVEQLMALVDALEAQLAASRATAANLLSALVAELTAQE